MNVEWSFIPPYSPHLGGLWEAGVKSCKYHLKWAMDTTLFTYEELSTVLVQIETCLSSRPLTPLSSDPSDLQPLTPGHFLISGPLTSLPEDDLSHINFNRSSWSMADDSTDSSTFLEKMGGWICVEFVKSCQMENITEKSQDKRSHIAARWQSSSLKVEDGTCDWCARRQEWFSASCYFAYCKQHSQTCNLQTLQVTSKWCSQRRLVV